MDVLRFGCPRGHRRRRARWTGWTEQLAHDLQGASVTLAGLHDQFRPRGHRQHEQQSPPHVSRVRHEVITFTVLGRRLLESFTL